METSNRERLRQRVAAEVRAAAGRENISAAELARRMGWKQSYMARRWDARVAYDVDDLEQIASALLLPVADLLPSSAREISSAPTVRYAQLNDRPPRPSSGRPTDNRPSGRPGVDLTPGVNRTSRLPRPPLRKAA